MKAILLLAALLAGCANATHPPASSGAGASSVKRTFLALDENRDGWLTRAEAAGSPVLARNFAQADANNDGLLNRYEFNSPSWRPFENEPD